MQEGTLADSILVRAAGLTVLGKSPAGVYLRLNRSLWERLPVALLKSRLLCSYGELLHRLVCLYASRRVFVGTFFLRNRPALDLMRRLVERGDSGSPVNIAVLGCSIGAEVYSIMYTLHPEATRRQVRLCATDISPKVLTFAQRGVYNQKTGEFLGTPAEESIFERLTETEKRELFDWEGSDAKIKPWLREDITWQVRDALDPQLAQLLGPQDIVVANNFLCHLSRADAERCLRNMARVIRPGGYLFVTGVDLDIRTKVARELAWKPVEELREEIHEGDPSIRGGWPWAWWGLEPLNKNRKDWELRYTAVFQVNQGR